MWHNPVPTHRAKSLHHMTLESHQHRVARQRDTDRPVLPTLTTLFLDLAAAQTPLETEIAKSGKQKKPKQNNKLVACLFGNVGIDTSGPLQQSDVKANPHLTVVNKQWGLETVPSTHTVDAAFQWKNNGAYP